MNVKILCELLCHIGDDKEVLINVACLDYPILYIHTSLDSSIVTIDCGCDSIDSPDTEKCMLQTYNGGI
jgi:hypothetical protein